MTVALEPPAIQDGGLDEQRRVAFDEMARQEAAFEASRLPCPYWCDYTCETVGHFGTAILHQSDAVTLAADADRNDETGAIRMWAQRHEFLIEPTSSLIEIDLEQSGSLIANRVHFTAAQARQLAAELQRHADLIEPEPRVPAYEVRVGDWFPLGDDWLYVYGVSVDEPSNTVQIFTTVDRDTYPELDGDEDGHHFTPDEMVRVRREGTR